MRRALVVSIAVAAVVVSVWGRHRVLAQDRGGVDLVTRAADAMGGRDRLLVIKTLTIEGYGQLAYQNGGGNITSSPDAPQKWVDLNAVVREFDLARGAARVRQRQTYDFVFAAEPQMRGVVTTQVVDGDTAYNVGPGGVPTPAPAATARARRMEMLAHPVLIVRAGLDPASSVSNRRLLGDLETVDITTARGDSLKLAVDRRTKLPAWVSWVGPDTNLGDVTYRASFTGYQPVGGVLMPTGLNTTIDFRGIVQQKLYVDRQAVDLQLAPFPEPPSAGTAPVPRPIEASLVAKGVWFLQGAGNSVLFEFNDHLTLFEAYASEANAQAVFEKARSIVPGKPLTEVIVSHHHFDHSGGLRAAVAEGLTIITQRGNESLFRELAERPAMVFRDALGRSRREIRLRLVDDSLRLRDGAMEIDIYRVVANSHMADALMVHVPRERLLVQGDLFDASWQLYWWGSSYMDNVQFRKIQVERDVPVHGQVLPIAEVRQHIERQIRNTQNLCASAEQANLSLRGCPVKLTIDR
jgi:glyoxylase-like metal-dependent hydrolase (beta-lactamase superfamily II)